MCVFVCTILINAHHYVAPLEIRGVMHFLTRTEAGLIYASVANTHACAKHF